ncbi:DUF2460 domain-containing protein [Sphingobium sp. MI1205]|uniref:DUF2460 domain-containing protein n=1 Tax=Sphingobium sp. MI1205 TaxID=407020 RepID=UPI000770208D|nr:DUF2460 domain-containing protein [Sphingobium sp. MI1205]AMK19329.1 glycoside hydrolase family protein [Sphingobium sp. MI1205]
MAFINEHLPHEVEIGAIRRDVEDIEIVTTDGGWEVRNARASQSLREFDISFPTSARDDSIYLAVVAMFKAARGNLHSFRFRDWADYQLTAEVIGTGNGVATAFQLKQSWTVDGVTQSRNITRPVSSLLVYKNGVQQLSGYSINYATGVLTFSSAPAIGVAVSVTGEFDIPVRFDGPLQTLGYSADYEHIETITLKEVRE